MVSKNQSKTSYAASDRDSGEIRELFELEKCRLKRKPEHQLFLCSVQYYVYDVRLCLVGCPPTRPALFPTPFLLLRAPLAPLVSTFLSVSYSSQVQREGGAGGGGQLVRYRRITVWG